nr:TRAP-T family transporter, DctM (12 TMs) subunit [uncultured bacterium]
MIADVAGELAVGGVALLGVLALIAIRVPIALSLMIVSVVGVGCLNGPSVAISVIKSVPFEFSAHWSLSAIPMFTLMGALAYHTGISSIVFRAARVWLAGLPGGLAVATNFGCAGFAAASGSSPATAATMARVAIPEMLAARYDKGLATGVVASGGTLGALIPPSILFVLFGVFAEVSISKLFIAGILPGLLTALAYAVMIIVRCAINPDLAPRVEPQAGEDRWRVLLETWPIFLLVFGIVFGLYGGLVTPTEAGAYGSFVTIAVGLLQRRLDWKSFVVSLHDAAATTAKIFIIAIGASFFTKFLAISGAVYALGEVAHGFVAGPIELFVVTIVIFIFLGMFLDPIGLMLIVIPVLLPFYDAAGLNLIWFGVIVVKLVEIGLLTPPVGFNVYVVHSVVGGEISLGTVFKGVAWFLVCEAILLLALFVFPQISLFLPNLSS